MINFLNSTAEVVKPIECLLNSSIASTEREG